MKMIVTAAVVLLLLRAAWAFGSDPISAYFNANPVKSDSGRSGELINRDPFND